jgi:epoxyqueuosine reductase
MQAGFVRCGVARAEVLHPEGEHLRAWLAAGHHGSMRYMERTAEVRIDPAHEGMLTSAMSVVVCAMPYASRAMHSGSPVPPAVGSSVAKYAKYAKYRGGEDYHRTLYKRLRPVARWLREIGHAARVAVDSMPVFERAWAARAGIGFVGKNSCLIIPGVGSHVFLAAIVTSAQLEPDAPMRSRCGQCTLCLDGCPTRAFVAPHQLDARRCLSYLTIEHREEISLEMRSHMGEWLFGCDDCQDVCPFNAPTAASQPRGGQSLDPAFDPLQVWQVSQEWQEWPECGPEFFLQCTEEEWNARFSHSALARAGRDQMARNAALWAGNRGERKHLPVLRDMAAHHPSSVVRDAASWAARSLDSKSSSAASSSSTPFRLTDDSE